jgi:uncharacterized membrane protein YoaK (UPF0700 family)
MTAESLHAKPGWVLTGGCLLAALASAVNADFMLRLGVSVSHLTGDLSRITSETVKSGGLWSTEASVLFLSVFGFISGAATSGFFIHHPNVELSRPYGRSVIAVGALLTLAHVAAFHSMPAACFLAAWACGMQNALATRYRGLVLRTTHITGLLTDLGQLLGMRLRGHPLEPWKITTPLLLALAFTLGSMGGALLNLKWHLPVTFLCGCLYLAGGVAWSWYKHVRLARYRAVVNETPASEASARNSRDAK